MSLAEQTPAETEFGTGRTLPTVIPSFPEPLRAMGRNVRTNIDGTVLCQVREGDIGSGEARAYAALFAAAPEAWEFVKWLAQNKPEGQSYGASLPCQNATLVHDRAKALWAKMQVRPFGARACFRAKADELLPSRQEPES